jgi:hypothetical protein
MYYAQIYVSGFILIYYASLISTNMYQTIHTNVNIKVCMSGQKTLFCTNQGFCASKYGTTLKNDVSCTDDHKRINNKLQIVFSSILVHKESFLGNSI